MDDPRTKFGLGDLVTDEKAARRRDRTVWIVRAPGRQRNSHTEVGLWNEKRGWRVADVGGLTLLRRKPKNHGRGAQAYRAMRERALQQENGNG